MFPGKKSIFYVEWRKYKHRIIQYAFQKIQKIEKKKELMNTFVIEEGIYH